MHSLSFTQGLLLGQLSVVVLIGAFIKFFIFGDAPSADVTAALRATERRSRTLAHTLGRTSFLQDLRTQLKLPSGAYAYSFQAFNLGLTVVVLWSTVDGVQANVPVSASVARATKIAIDGTATDAGLPDKVPLTLGPTPVYVMLEE